MYNRFKIGITFVFVLVLCLFAGVVSASDPSIINTTVTNTNIYASSGTAYQISPTDGAVAEISVANRYIYYTGIEAVPSVVNDNETLVTYRLLGQQGASVQNSTSGVGTMSGMLISPESGVSSDYIYDYVYSTQGTKTVTVTSATNPSGSYTLTSTANVYVYYPPDLTGFTVKTSPTEIKANSSQTVALSLSSVPSPQTGDTYSYNWYCDGVKITSSSLSTPSFSWNANQPSGTHNLTCEVTSNLGQVSSYVNGTIKVLEPSITNCVVSNTNIVATSGTRYDIAPDIMVGSGNTATGIVHNTGEYLYATGVSISPTSGYANETVYNLSISNQRGASINYANNAVYLASITDTIGTYTINAYDKVRNDTGGSFQPSVALSNPSMDTPLTFTSNTYTVSLPFSVQSISKVSPTSPDVPLGETIQAKVTIASNPRGTITYQWYISTDNSTYTAISGQTSNSLSYTPSVHGTYYFKCIVSNGKYNEDTNDLFSPIVYQTFTGLTNNNVNSNADLATWNAHIEYYNDKTLNINANFTPNTTITSFAGTLNGNNHLMSGLTAPLFASLTGTVNNLKFNTSIISSANYAGILATQIQGANINNVDVENCNIKANYAGGLVGNILSGGASTIQNCDIKLCTIIGSSSAGGISPVTQSNTVIKYATVTQCDISSSNGKSYGVSP